MGLLLLSGGGNAEIARTTNEYFVNRIDKEKPLLYIPIAGDPTRRSYESSHSYMKNMFTELGVKNTRMWTDLTNKTVEDLIEYSAIFISGGDPIKLLDHCKTTGFDDVLIHYYESGGTIYGQSAGAMIFGESIAHTVNQKIECINAYNLFNNFSVWPHYIESDNKKIEKLVKKYNRSFYAIPDGVAIAYDGEALHIISDNNLRSIKVFKK